MIYLVYILTCVMQIKVDLYYSDYVFFSKNNEHC